MDEQTMDYEAGYVYKLMDQGGPTDNRQPQYTVAGRTSGDYREILP